MPSQRWRGRTPAATPGKEAGSRQAMPSEDEASLWDAISLAQPGTADNGTKTTSGQCSYTGRLRKHGSRCMTSKGAWLTMTSKAKGGGDDGEASRRAGARARRVAGVHSASWCLWQKWQATSLQPEKQGDPTRGSRGWQKRRRRREQSLSPARRRREQPQLTRPSSSPKAHVCSRQSG